jgi:maleamate amidohydrolase
MEAGGRAWDRFLTDGDKQVFAAAGYGRRYGFGARPALLIIDVNYGFVGDRPAPILESVKKWRLSCGQAGWDAIVRIQAILAGARDKGVPVIYTHEEFRSDLADRGVWGQKNSRTEERTDVEGHLGVRIVTELAPAPRDLHVYKKNASAFFGTNLASMLIGLGVDTLVVTGCTTSGCVRATVVDGQSYNFRMIVPEEAVFDRGEASHAMSLWDMNAKYADVVSVQETLDYLRRLP